MDPIRLLTVSLKRKIHMTSVRILEFPLLILTSETLGIGLGIVIRVEVTWIL